MNENREKKGKSAIKNDRSLKHGTAYNLNTLNLFKTVSILYSETTGEKQPKGVSISMTEIGTQTIFLT